MTTITREFDTMDEQKYFELRRDIDKNVSNFETQHHTLEVLMQRQNKHEEKFEIVFERLVESFNGIDKKLEVFIVQSATTKSLWLKMVQIVPSILFSIIAGWWTYQTSLESDTHKEFHKVLVQQEQVKN